MAAEEKTAKQPPKVMDIAPANSAQATSRPVIVGHGTIIRDPMMAPASWDDAPPAKSEIVINTPDDAEKAAKPKTETETSADVAPGSADESAVEPDTTPGNSDTDTAVEQDAAPAPAAESSALPSIKSDEPEPQVSASADKSAATATAPKKTTVGTKKIQPLTNNFSAATKSSEKPLDPLGPQNAATAKPKDAPDSQQAPKEPMAGNLTLDQLAELKAGKKYKVAISKNHAAKTSWLAIVAILILLAAGVVLVIDAGWVDFGFNLPFDLIQ